MNGNTKIDQYSADRWLRGRGGVPKSTGIGLKMDLHFDASAVRTNAKELSKAYLRNKHGKASQ